MTQSPLTIERTVAKWLALDVRSLNITYAQLLRLSSDNEGLRFELSADGMLIVMPPASLSSSGQNALLTEQLARWTRHDGSGKSFDSSGGFTLPNGAIRSPDAAWVLLEKWLAFEAADVEAFPSIPPDFAVELRSPSDRLAIIQAKMVEYMENGVRLGWLIDPRQRRLYVYRPEQPPEVLEDPGTVSADPLLPGFVLDLTEIW
jgi:Uma2 family endonuclease